MSRSQGETGPSCLARLTAASTSLTSLPAWDTGDMALGQPWSGVPRRPGSVSEWACAGAAPPVTLRELSPPPGGLPRPPFHKMDCEKGN